MTDQDFDPGAAWNGDAAPARESEPDPPTMPLPLSEPRAPDPAVAAPPAQAPAPSSRTPDPAELEALRSRLTAKFRGRR